MIQIRARQGDRVAQRFRRCERRPTERKDHGDRGLLPEHALGGYTQTKSRSFRLFSRWLLRSYKTLFAPAQQRRADRLSEELPCALPGAKAIGERVRVMNEEPEGIMLRDLDGPTAIRELRKACS